MKKVHGLQDGYYATWIRQRYRDDPQLILQQLHDLQAFRSTRHQAGYKWPICRCIACQGMIIVQQIAAQLLTPTISHELMHTDC